MGFFNGREEPSFGVLTAISLHSDNKKRKGNKKRNEKEEES